MRSSGGKYNKNYTKYSKNMAALIITRWSKRRLDFMKQLKQDLMLQEVAYILSDHDKDIDEEDQI